MLPGVAPGVTAGEGEVVGVGVAVTAGVAVEDGFDVGRGVGVGVAPAVGDALGFGDGLGDGAGVGVAVAVAVVVVVAVWVVVCEVVVVVRTVVVSDAVDTTAWVTEAVLLDDPNAGDAPWVVELPAAETGGWGDFAGVLITGAGGGAGGRTAGWTAIVPVVTSAVTPAAPVPAGRSRGINPRGAPASGASQAVKPTVRHSRLIEIVRKARTRVGSRWVPEERTSSRRAAATPIGRLYGRAAVIVSKASTTATMRAPREISRPRSPWG